MSTIGSLLRALPECAKYLAPLAASPQIQADLEDAIRCVAPGRLRRLPPSLTFWLVLLMGAWRDESQLAVFERLRGIWKSLVRVTDGAIAHARKRLGVQPLRRFCDRLFARCAPPPSFHGFCVHAFDGVRVSVPDTPPNRKRFRRPASPGNPAFPQALLLMLASVTTRCVRAVSLHHCRQNERRPALELLQGLGLGRNDLVIFDSGFYAAWFVRALDALGIAYLIRVPDSVKNFRPLADSPGRFEVTTRYLREGKRGRRQGRSRSIRIQGRVVTYSVDGARTRLLTNLPGRISDQEIAQAYRWRWEIELLYDELKTHLAAPAKGTNPALFRSRQPELLEQEIYSLLALYNLLRLNIASAARLAKVAPVEMSFVNCLRVLRRAVEQPAPRTTAQAAAASRRMLREMAFWRIDRPRRLRQAPRAVRQPFKPFRSKGPHDKTRKIPLKSRRLVVKAG